MNTGTNIQGLRRRKWQAVISIAIVVVLLAGIFWGMGGTGLFLPT